MAHDPTTTRHLIAALRELATREPQCREELAALEQECVALTLRIGDMPCLGAVPEIIWHFLADPDIRFKDAVYAQEQRKGLAAVLAACERRIDG